MRNSLSEKKRRGPGLDLEGCSPHHHHTHSLTKLGLLLVMLPTHTKQTLGKNYEEATLPQTKQNVARNVCLGPFRQMAERDVSADVSLALAKLS